MGDLVFSLTYNGAKIISRIISHERFFFFIVGINFFPLEISLQDMFF